MRRKEKQKAKVEYEEDEENDKRASSSMLITSSDDEEANEDLSLKIVEKALRMREAKLASNDGVLVGEGGGDVGLETAEIKIKKKKKKAKKVESGDQSIIIAEEHETREPINARETNESAEVSTVQMGDNIVLRKLLRGPRYFDPPDSNWGTCFNCGEGGHTAVNCKVAKRKKPCFVCGSLEHAAKQCIKARDCFICKKGGHRAADCPEKHKGRSKSSTMCLKCGNSGHDMFSCNNSYSLDDLKEIQCYVCQEFGHLCCVNFDDATLWEVSCYKCGQLGHTGLACSRLRGETTGAATPSSCFKCGEEGHFARECTSSAKVRKRNRELSKTPRSHREKDYKEYGSAPPDISKAHKNKKVLSEDIGVTTPWKSKRRGDWMTEDTGEFPSPKFKERGLSTPKKSKRRGGWMTEDPGDFSTPKFKEKLKRRGGWMTEDPGDFSTPKFKEKLKRRGGWMTEDPGEFSPRKFKNRWMSPATPSSKSTNKTYSGSHTPSSRWKGHAGSSKSQGSAKAFQPRFSASRFGNSSTGLPRYDWW